MKPFPALACLSVLLIPIMSLAEDSKKKEDAPSVEKDSKATPTSEAKPEARLNEVKPPADGDYMLKVSFEADDPKVQLPRAVIPDEAYQPLKKEGATLKIRISEHGKKITIAGDAGTLEKQTATESIYDLPEGGSAKAGAQLRLKHTAGGIIGTYTIFGSGLPVLSSVRGAVTPAPAK
jgi:hypothetical protein